MPTINFVGREKELNDFDNFLTAKEEGVFVVIGEIGIWECRAKCIISSW